MAELILTQAETDALSWLDLDDDALGKVTRNGMIELAKVAEDDHTRLLCQVAGFVLVGMAVRLNADQMDLTFGGMTHADHAIGDWTIEVRKRNSPEEADHD